MGTEVHVKSYLPGSFNLGDLIEDKKAVWTRFDGETHNEYLYSGLMSMSVDSCSEYYKTVLRQTMLRHQEIFRKQVIELHRLYRVQIDMMLELKEQEKRCRTSDFRNELEKCQLRSCFRLINGNFSLAGISESEEAPKSLNLPDSCFSLSSWGFDYYKKDQYLNSRPHKTSNKQQFDLHLPAESECDVDLSLGASFCCDRLSKRPCSSLRKWPDAQTTADLKGAVEKSGEETSFGFPLHLVHSGRVEEHTKEPIGSFFHSPGFPLALNPGGCNFENAFAFPCNFGSGKTGGLLESLVSASLKETQQSSQSVLLDPAGVHHTLPPELPPNQAKTESKGKFDPSSNIAATSLRIHSGNLPYSIDLNLIPPSECDPDQEFPGDSRPGQTQSNRDRDAEAAAEAIQMISKSETRLPSDEGLLLLADAIVSSCKIDYSKHSQLKETEMAILCWGRTTRRGRRQRCPVN